MGWWSFGCDDGFTIHDLRVFLQQGQGRFFGHSMYTLNYGVVDCVSTGMKPDDTPLHELMR